MTDVGKAIDQIASDMVKATLSYARDELIQEAHNKLDATTLISFLRIYLYPSPLQ